MMGKTKRRKGFELPLGGVYMRERVEKPKPAEWIEEKKAEKQKINKLRKLKKK